MTMTTTPLGIDDARIGSGTSWLPDDTVMDGAMRHAGAWMLMLHGGGFLQFIKAGSTRGDDQFGSINWLMGMAQRQVAGGSFTVRSMLSVEPLTVGRCGYPDLMQTGEACNGAALHDRQHPHDLFMEVAADYRRTISESAAIEIYGGPAGEPALGPVAYPHRPSAMPDPVAPMSHHWLDSTHGSFGVITGGVYGRKWKAEASAFNGREPDDRRYGFDLAALDSYSGRFWLLPTSHWALQISAGRLTSGEFHEDAAPEDVTRVTASATFHRTRETRLWATTVAWGRNIESERSTSAFVAETAMEMTAREVWFGRLEVVGKTATDLGLPSATDEVFTVTKARAGYTRWLTETAGMTLGVGAAAGLAFLPADLESHYGTRWPAEMVVYLTLRPR